MNLGEVIKFIRTEIFGLSLLDFGEILNLSSSTLQRYEYDDFGKKFTSNKYIKLRDISERISGAIFNEYAVVRKTKNFYVNNDITKMGFNKKIKNELEKLYEKSKYYCKDNFEKLKNIDIETENGLIEFIYTFFLLYIGADIEEIKYERNVNEFIKIVDTNKDRISDYKKCLSEAKGEIFITGTSMVHLSEDSGHILQEKAKEGVIKLLILDPDWIEKHSEILTFLDYEDRKEFSYEIKNSIRKLKALKRGLSNHLFDRISIKTYCTIFPYIITGYSYKESGKLVVEITDYIPETFRPRFTLQKNEKNNLYNLIRKKFNSLWNNDILTNEVQI